jgi:hypothetical protein
MEACQLKAPTGRSRSCRRQLYDRKVGAESFPCTQTTQTTSSWTWLCSTQAREFPDIFKNEICTSEFKKIIFFHWYLHICLKEFYFGLWEQTNLWLYIWIKNSYFCQNLSFSCSPFLRKSRPQRICIPNYLNTLFSVAPKNCQLRNTSIWIMSDNTYIDKRLEPCYNRNYFRDATEGC